MKPNNQSTKNRIFVVLSLFILIFPAVFLSQSAEAQESEAADFAPITSEIISLDGDTLSLERPGTIRTLFQMSDKNRYIPETLSFSASDTGSGTITMFVSATLSNSAGEPGYGGLLIKAEIDPISGEIVTFEKRKFDECSELSGVQSSPNGDVVAALCSTPANAPVDGNTIDLVEKYLDNGAELKNVKGSEVRLYEWRGSPADIQADPTKFIVAKDVYKSGISKGLTFGHNDYTYNEYGTYGISLPTYFGKHGNHTADSFTVIQRGETVEDYKIMKMRHAGQKPGQWNFKMNFRGWSHSCTAGHPPLISTGFNPDINVDNPWTLDKVEKAQYAVLCMSEANTVEGHQEFAGIAFTRDNSYVDDGTFQDNEKGTFHLLQKQGWGFIKGGVGPLLPFGNGWIGVIVGSDAPLDQLRGNSSDPASKIGIVKFNHKGEVVDNINWIDKPAGMENNYVSYPQLVPLDAASGKYLLGFGVMPAQADPSKTMSDTVKGLMHPETFYLQEVQILNIDNGDGDNGTDAISINSLSSMMPLADGVGWGMLDHMVPLGNQKVGWSAYNMDRMTVGPNGELPNPLTNELQFNVYTSPGS